MKKCILLSDRILLNKEIDKIFNRLMNEMSELFDEEEIEEWYKSNDDVINKIIYKKATSVCNVAFL